MPEYNSFKPPHEQMKSGINTEKKIRFLAARGGSGNARESVHTCDCDFCFYSCIANYGPGCSGGPCEDNGSCAG